MLSNGPYYKKPVTLDRLSDDKLLTKKILKKIIKFKLVLESIANSLRQAGNGAKTHEKRKSGQQ